jgi:hypothetical protein
LHRDRCIWDPARHQQGGLPRAAKQIDLRFSSALQSFLCPVVSRQRRSAADFRCKRYQIDHGRHHGNTDGTYRGEVKRYDGRYQCQWQPIEPTLLHRTSRRGLYETVASKPQAKIVSAAGNPKTRLLTAMHKITIAAMIRSPHAIVKPIRRDCEPRLLSVKCARSQTTGYDKGRRARNCNAPDKNGGWNPSWTAALSLSGARHHNA